MRRVQLILVVLAAACGRASVPTAPEPTPVVDAGAPIDAGLDACAWAPRALPEPVAQWLQPPPLAGAVCTDGVRVDGAGRVAFFIGEDGSWPDPPPPQWVIASPDGGRLDGLSFGGVDPNQDFIGQSEGFLAAQCTFYEDDSSGAFFALAFMVDGGRGGGMAGTFAGCSFQPDPAGGATFSIARYPASYFHESELVRYGGDGRQLFSVVASDDGGLRFAGHATDTEARMLTVLSVSDGGTVARWLEPDGTPGAFFDGSPLRDEEFLPKIGGGFFTRRSGAADAAIDGVLESSGTELQPAPAWAAAIHDAEITFIASQHGYVVRPFYSNDDGGQRLYFVGVDGEACGFLDVPASDFQIGPDGSLAVAGGPPSPSGPGYCTATIWRQVLH